VGRTKWFGCIVALVVAIAAGCTSPPAPVGKSRNGAADKTAVVGGPVVRTTGAPSVVFYGDSLTWESTRYIPALAGQKGLAVTEHSFVATAICDWFPDMWARLPKERPTVVVIAFYGNSWTKCMSDGHGGWLQGAAKAAKYERDAAAATAIALASGSRVVLVGAPRSRDQMSDPQWEGVRNAYRRVARQYPDRVVFRDAGEDIAPNGVYSPTRPCLARERDMVNADGSHVCENGETIVRAPDGLHFCPHGLDNAIGQPGHCPRYMSGGYRYIRTLVDAASHAAEAVHVRATTLPRPAAEPLSRRS
jgi:hypothetical protein